MRVEITPRQKEVLDLLLEGLDTIEIGVRLGITDGTARNHARDILRAFDCSKMVRVAWLYGRGDVELIVVNYRWMNRRVA